MAEEKKQSKTQKEPQAQEKKPVQKSSPSYTEETTASIERIGNFLSLYGILMFSMALVLDLVGFILLILDIFGIGLVLSFIPDIIGLIFIGGLMLLSPSGGVVVTKGVHKFTKKVGKKIAKRLGLGFLGELIPVFGDVMPCWTLAVYFHLKGG